MGFNVAKCHILTVSRKREPVQATYTLHQQPLERVRAAKYLGVELTTDLNWGEHIQAICTKGNRTSAFVTRNLKGCPTSVQTYCYKALARPTLEYSSPVWDPHQKNHYESLEMVQRRAARRITRDFSRDSSATALVASLGLPTLIQRRKQDKVALMYKILNDHLDCRPKPGTLIYNEMPTRGHSRKLQQLQSTTDSYLHSFFPSAIRLWNSLPAAAVCAPSLLSFRSQLEGWKWPT